MPICKTCRGEYPQGRRQCPRCGSDVTAWEQKSSRQWSAPGLIPSILAAIVLLLFWARREPSIHHWLVSMMSIALSLLVFVALYTTRHVWRERRWASQVYNASRPQVTMMIVATFVGGIAMSIISFILYKIWRPPPVPFWQQLIFGAAYAPIYVLFTASLTLGMVQAYVSRLDQRVPPPLFMDTERLLRVTVEAALQSLSVPGKSSARRASHSYEVIEALRIPENGGVSVLLYERRQVSLPGSSSRTGVQWVEKGWRIKADRWGRVKSVRPEKLKAG